MKKVPAYFSVCGCNSYTDQGHDRKQNFHRDGKKILMALADEIGLPQGSYDIRSNKAGIAVSGEVTLHAEHLYLQMYEPSFNSTGISLLYRSCANRTDFTGDQNNTLNNVRKTLNDEVSRASFIAHCRRLVATCDALPA